MGHSRNESGGFHLGHVAVTALATAAWQTVGLGQEGMFQVRTGMWNEGGEGGSHQSRIRKEPDR